LCCMCQIEPNVISRLSQYTSTLTLLLLIACAAEPSDPHRIETFAEREKRRVGDSLDDAAAKADASMFALDSGLLSPFTSDAMAPLDAGASRSSLHEAGSTTCDSPFQFFAPGCGATDLEGQENAERWPVLITSGCYRRCSGSYDPVCGPGTRCGIAGIHPCLCSGTCCAAICAHVWLCLPPRHFPASDEDAGALDEDGGAF